MAEQTLPEPDLNPPPPQLAEPQSKPAVGDGETVMPVSTELLRGRVEALLIMAEEPVAAVTLAEALGVPVNEITPILTTLADFYDETNRGFELRHVGGGWRYYTRAEHHDFIRAWVLEGQQSKLSQAALETLAVIAYLQPISRGRVSAVRGVNVDGVVRTLLARELIQEAGADETSGAALFMTTDLFLEKLGITSLQDLPELAPHLPEAQALEAELAALAEERAVAATAPNSDIVDEPLAAKTASSAEPAPTTINVVHADVVAAQLGTDPASGAELKADSSMTAVSQPIADCEATIPYENGNHV